MDQTNLPISKFPPLINLTLDKPRNTSSIISFNSSIPSSSDHPNLGTYGVITVVLIDPFSQLMNRIINTDEHQPNAIGFYYPHNHQKIITLFYHHDGTPVPWIGPHTSLETLFTSMYVHKIRCYPLISHHDRLKTLISKIVPHKPNYHKLLLHIFDLHEGHFETGSTLVIKLLKDIDPTINDLSGPLLKRHISIKSSRKDKSDIILETSRKSLENIVIVFIDLFTNKHQFRNIILNIKKNRLNKEHDLITNIVCSIEHGILSTDTVNELITNLEQLDQNHHFPKIKNPKATIEVTEEPLMCTFNESSTDLTKLHKLGAYIATLPCDHTLITLYNDAIKETNLDPLPIHSPSMTVKTSKSTITLSIHHPDLSSLSESELKDVLIYIDSLRSSNGTSDNRFAPLQNAILGELANR